MDMTREQVKEIRRDEILDAVSQARSQSGLEDGWVEARDVADVFDRWERQTGVVGAEGPGVRAIVPRLTAAFKRGELERSWVADWRVFVWRRARNEASRSVG